MLAVLLFLAGATASAYCLWQFRRWLQEAEAATAARPRELERLTDELLATAEMTTAVVQEKSEVLQGLIEEADRRVATLARREEQPPAPVIALQPRVDEPPVTPEVVAPPLPEPVVEQAPIQPEAPVPAQEESRLPVERADMPVLHQQVLALAAAGRDEASIARELGLGRGEVRLILDLRRKA